MGHGIHMDAPVPAVDPLEAQRYEEDYDHSQVSLIHMSQREEYRTYDYGSFLSKHSSQCVHKVDSEEELLAVANPKHHQGQHPQRGMQLQGDYNRILCRTTAATAGAEEGYAILTIYADLEGNATISDIAELK